MAISIKEDDLVSVNEASMITVNAGESVHNELHYSESRENKTPMVFMSAQNYNDTDLKDQNEASAMAETAVFATPALFTPSVGPISPDCLENSIKPF